MSPGSICCQIHPPWPRTCFKTEVLQQFPLLICSTGFHFASSSSCLLSGRKQPVASCCGGSLHHPHTASWPRHAQGATYKPPCHPQRKAPCSTATSSPALYQHRETGEISKCGEVNCAPFRVAGEEKCSSGCLLASLTSASAGELEDPAHGGLQEKRGKKPPLDELYKAAFQATARGQALLFCRGIAQRRKFRSSSHRSKTASREGS